MRTAVFVILNLAPCGVFILLLRKPALLATYLGGKMWLTWLAVAIITLMDELSSVFYAPAEVYRSSGPAQCSS